MLHLTPVTSNKIWGYELWIASTHPNGLQQDFVDFCGGDYPLLVKIIQADETLSVQVHPDDEWAKKLEGKDARGKTECWYVLESAPGAKLVYGLKDGVEKSVMAQAITENNLEPYLETVEVCPGDFIYIPAGTVHAIGGGLRLLEVQQSCDTTYRLYDWGRGREVHIDKGLAVIKNNVRQPVVPFKNFKCEYFSLEEITSGKVCSDDDVVLLFVLDKNGAEINGTHFDYESIMAIKNEEVAVKGKVMVIRNA